MNPLQKWDERDGPLIGTLRLFGIREGSPGIGFGILEK